MVVITFVNIDRITIQKKKKKKTFLFLPCYLLLLIIYWFVILDSALVMITACQREYREMSCS